MCSMAQSQRALRSGMMLFPSGVSEYSTLGGTWVNVAE
jgi:hypothetical protein